MLCGSYVLSLARENSLCSESVLLAIRIGIAKSPCGLSMRVLSGALDKMRVPYSALLHRSKRNGTDKHTVKYVAIQHAGQSGDQSVLSIELDAAASSGS